MIRTKGEAGTGNIVEAVRHMRLINSQVRKVQNMSEDELYTEAKNLAVPLCRLKEVRDLGRLPVVNFAAGGIATPADAALMMQLGADGNFVGSGIFKSDDPERRARAIVEATAHYEDAKLLGKVSRGLSGAMKGIDIRDLSENQKLQTRGV